MLQTFLPRQVKVFQPGAASVLWNTSPGEQVNGGCLPLETRGFLRARCPVAAARFNGAAIRPLVTRDRAADVCADRTTGIASTSS
jgi:hypothetical protein